MKEQSPGFLDKEKLRAVFMEQLSILYNAKLSLAARLPGLISQASFLNLQLALEENLEDNGRQMVALKSIFSLMEESWLTNDCLGMNALIDEAHRQVSFDRDKRFKSDLSILFYMNVIENLQVGAGKLLNVIALKLAYQPYQQLVRECLDTAKDNAGLFHWVAKEYIEN